MATNTREDDDLVLLSDNAELYEDYGYEDYGYEDYGCEDHENYGDVDGDRGRRQTTGTEITDATSDDRGMEEQISEQREGKDIEQDEDAEEMEQSGESNEG